MNQNVHKAKKVLAHCILSTYILRKLAQMLVQIVIILYKVRLLENNAGRILI